MIVKLLKNESGQAMLLAGLVSAAVAAGAFYLMSPGQDGKSLKINNVKYSAEMVKENLMSVLDNDAAWAKTIELNPSLACLKTSGAVCDPSSFGAINVYDADGALVSGTAAAAGLDLSGRPCSRYSTTDPDSVCIFKYEIQWSCNGACGPTKFIPGITTAASPRIRLISNFQYSPKDKELLNQLSGKNKVYTFNFIRGSKGKTLSQYCNSIEGVFDQTSNTCKSAMSKPDYFNCTDINPHSWFVGFKKDGTPICKTDARLGQSCPNGTAVTGYMEDGRIVCGAF